MHVALVIERGIAVLHIELMAGGEVGVGRDGEEEEGKRTMKERR